VWKVLFASEVKNDDSSPEEAKPVFTLELRCTDCGCSTTIITHSFEWEIHGDLDGTCPKCGSRDTTEVHHVCTVQLRCAICGYSKMITHWFEWEIHDGLEGPCPHCRSRQTTVTKVAERRYAHAVPDPRKKNPPEPYNPYKHVGESGPTFPDPPKENPRKPNKHKQVCRGCNRWFVPGPNHVGYINVCPECWISMAFKQLPPTPPAKR